MEIVPGSGDAGDEGKFFGDVQVHAWCWRCQRQPPAAVWIAATSNPFLQGRYEVKNFDEFENPIYADGQIGAIKGPVAAALANAGRKPN